uniref:E3 ubiquitin-protein ligase CHFR n=1 Tax=Xenopsylla cheopis TaxID=163159 RepID=A0A6M2DKU8_XENCH
MDDVPHLISNNDDKLLFKGTKYTIGRDLSNDHIIADIAISRFHLKFAIENDEWTVTDKSTGGTLVNNEKLAKNVPYVLQNNDVVTIACDYNFKFVKPQIVTPKVVNKRKRKAEESIDIDNKENMEFIESCKKFREEFEAEHTCAVCSEMFINAIILKCGHRFCKSCITRWKQTKKTCPVCRAGITIEVVDVHVDNTISSFFRHASNDVKANRDKIVSERIEIEKTLRPKKSDASTNTRRRRTRTTTRSTTRGNGRRTNRSSILSGNSVIIIDDSDTSVISSDDEFSAELDAIYAALSIRFPFHH